MNGHYVEALKINEEIFKTAVGSWRVKVKEPWTEIDSSRLTYEITFVPEESDLPIRNLKLQTYKEILLVEKRIGEIVRRIFDWLESEEGDGDISINFEA